MFISISIFLSMPPVNNLDQRGWLRPEKDGCDIGACEAWLENFFTLIFCRGVKIGFHPLTIPG